MSKDESNNDGLLSKVVRFVRNPTVNWNELDNLEAERESQYSKQMLKEMIERREMEELSPLAAKSAQSRGRDQPIKPCELRS